ncbi:MAG: acyl-CoA mutase large subunit family protein, partial [Thermodesulfobacteriota bacterium]|nr:acyl-CoA mutase large subunit family protein [Thermodesulfobacteriota bacterium]
MFTQKVKDENEEMQKLWQEQISNMPAPPGMTKELKFTTRSGIALKPVYTPQDLMGLKYEEIGLPGVYPFTRGKYPLHYQVIPFLMNQGYGLGTAKETRDRRKWLEKLGSRFHVGREEDMVVYILAVDLPTQRGLDPDDPAARGKVGECGISLSTLKDFEVLYENLPLEQVFTVLIGFDAGIILTALYAAYAQEIRKEPLDKLFFVACNYFHHQWCWDSAGFPPPGAMKLATEYTHWVVKNCPLSFHGAMDGYNVGEAGATPVQEVAFNLAHSISLVEECIKVGLSPDDVAGKFMGHPHISLNFFEEIAKIRALRRLWAKIFKERFGCKKPESLQYNSITAQTAGVELTAQEPLNNIIRTTIMSLAAMMADVDGAWISSYDEALGIPTEEAVQVAVRTYQILGEETDIPYVTDPLGGSYYIESLTTSMEEEILKLLKKMDDLGGYIKCWESGWIRGEVHKSAMERLGKLESGE